MSITSLPGPVHHNVFVPFGDPVPWRQFTEHDWTAPALAIKAPAQHNHNRSPSLGPWAQLLGGFQHLTSHQPWCTEDGARNPSVEEPSWLDAQRLDDKVDEALRGGEVIVLATRVPVVRGP